MTRRWELWLPARLGPRRTYRVRGEKVKERRLELPPGPNGSRGNPIARGKWVKEWRGAARDAAKAAGIPHMARIRVSAVFRRSRIGVADEDNDRARLKPILDSLRDAGVIANDTRGYIEWGSVTEERGEPGVLLIVEEVPL